MNRSSLNTLDRDNWDQLERFDLGEKELSELCPLQVGFNISLLTDPRPFPYNWAEELDPFLLQYCQDVKIFYETAADKNFGIVSKIG